MNHADLLRAKTAQTVVFWQVQTLQVPVFIRDVRTSWGTDTVVEIEPQGGNGRLVVQPSTIAYKRGG